MRTVKEALKQKLVQEGVVGHEGKIPKGQLAPPVQGGHQATKVRMVAQAARQSPGTADSSGDYFALHHDSGAWTIKEYGTKENAYSLCQFISKRS